MTKVREKASPALQEIEKGVFLVPQNGRTGFGYSHFVVCPGGNLLLDASRVGSLTDSFPAMSALGGVQTVVISDRHLGGISTHQLAEHFGASVWCSAIEAKAMAHREGKVQIDHVLPFERTKIAVGVELIPTPGHTPGQFSTLLKMGRRNILFTADFLWREQGKWRPGSLSRRKIVATFESLRALRFDAIIPWTGYDQTEFIVPVPSVDKAVDAMIAACSKP